MADGCASPWLTVYIGLGSNLDHPEAQVRQAYADLSDIPAVRPECCSSLYRSRPFGVVDQPDFINAVACLKTTLSALDLLICLKRQEQRQGRGQGLGSVRWGPRSIDLDILLYGQEQIVSDVLTVPHAGLLQRDFVLYPLFEIAPDLGIPGLGPLVDCLAACPQRGLERLDQNRGQNRGQSRQHVGRLAG